MESIYVCLFSNGHIKVGRSIDPQSRIAAHCARVSCVGVQLTESKVFSCVESAAECERQLIDFCQENATARNQNEWFEGLSFDLVASQAEKFAKQDPATDAPTGWAAYLMRVQRCGYTQTKLAEMLGCAQPSIAGVLSGRTVSPSFRVGYGLLQIGRMHGVPDPVELFPIKAEAK